MKTIAIIPARAGSKGIPNKNLVEVAGKPLIQWTIEAANKSECIDTIVVTSDGESILNHAKKYERVITLKRPESLAQDTTPTLPVVEHVLEKLNISLEEYTYLILLQPTSPLRTTKHIDDAFKTIEASNATSLISMSLPEHHPLKSFVKNDEGFLEGIVNNEYPFMPRQELPKVYQPNGAIYIIELKSLLEDKSFFTNKTIEFLMSTKSSVDIDTIEDIKKVESYVNG